MSPVAVPCTIREEKSSAVEFRVTVPLFVKSPETVKEPPLAIVKAALAPTSKFFTVAPVVALITGLLALTCTFESFVAVGATPFVQLAMSVHSVSFPPVQLLSVATKIALGCTSSKDITVPSRPPTTLIFNKTWLNVFVRFDLLKDANSHVSAVEIV